MNEREFQDAVVDIAHLYGWRAFHARAAGTNKGYRTPVAYDGKGYVDLTLVHPSAYIIFAEINSAVGRLSDEQKAWSETLTSASEGINTWHDESVMPVRRDRVLYRLWRPRDGDEIVTLLSFGRVRQWTP